MAISFPTMRKSFAESLQYKISISVLLFLLSSLPILLHHLNLDMINILKLFLNLGETSPENTKNGKVRMINALYYSIFKNFNIKSRIKASILQTTDLWSRMWLVVQKFWEKLLNVKFDKIFLMMADQIGQRIQLRSWYPSYTYWILLKSIYENGF